MTIKELDQIVFSGISQSVRLTTAATRLHFLIAMLSIMVESNNRGNTYDKIELSRVSEDIRKNIQTIVETTSRIDDIADSLDAFVDDDNELDVCQATL